MKNGESASSGVYYSQSEQTQKSRQEEKKFDGARLIAPSIPIFEHQADSEGAKPEKLSGFQAALSGAYSLESPVLDMRNQVVYSVDMVRLEFLHDNMQQVIDCIDKQTVLATMETYTSNRIGNYKFMWIFRYANGEHGGYRIELSEDEIIEDGDKDVVLKVGYGVVSGSGATNKKGFVEFNPNKCEGNGRKFLLLLESIGCVFSLRRWDLAIDYSVARNVARLIRDRRTYEFILSSKGGVTEYLGQRNAPGRVKLYDKAGEQGLDCDLTRVELTCESGWGERKIMEYLPVVHDYGQKARLSNGVLGALVAVIGDMLLERGDDGEYTYKALSVVPEKYFAMVARNTRSRWKKALKAETSLFEYDEQCISKCLERAISFVP